MGIKRVAMLIVLPWLLGVQPAQAEWKDSLVRSVAPTLVNRAINYLTRQRPQPRVWAPATEEKPARAISRAPAAAAKKSPSTNIPAAPVVTPEELGLIPQSSGNATRSSSGKFEIPPPPKVLVPPPPPGVPTGAILGLYPQELGQFKPDSISNDHQPATSADNDPPMPKVAPDFRRMRQTNNR